MDCKQWRSHVWLLLFCAVVYGRVDCVFVYFPNYFPYDRTYETCLNNNMRVLRVEDEAKHERVLNFTQGLTNFDFYVYSVRISLRYDVNSSAYKWPNGIVNTFTTKWADGQPLDPEINQCVTQYGRGSKIGQWKAHDCETRSPFICETEHPNLSAWNQGQFYPYYQMFKKMPQDMNGGADNATFDFHSVSSDLNLYKGFRISYVELCALHCHDDPLCVHFTYIFNEDETRNLCMFLW